MKKIKVLREIDLGRNLVTTSSEAAVLFGLALSTFKRKEKFVSKGKNSDVKMRTAGRYSGRALRNLKVYLGRIELGAKPKQALQYVQEVDSFLESAFVYSDETINVKDLNSSDFMAQISPKKSLLHEPSMDLTRFLPKIDEPSDEDWERSRKRRLLERCIDEVEKFATDLRKCGFLLSTDTELQCLMYLLKETVDELDVKITVTVEKSKDKPKIQSPIKQISLLTKQYR